MECGFIMGSKFILTKGFTPKIGAIICIIALLSSATVIAMSALCSLAVAGTENGEFCPTCPDWTNLEGWLAQKDAYEKAQQTGPYAGTATNSNANSLKTNINPDKPVRSYPAQSIITNAGASLNGIVPLDVRSPEDYRMGHIPGARNIYWRSIETNDVLDPALAEAALCSAGINNTDRILIYGSTDEGASFMFWALSYLGHKNISRLDGDANAAWIAGIKPEKGNPLIKKSNYTIHATPELLVGASSLKAFISQMKVQILDARDFTDYGKSKLTNAALQFQADTLYDADKKVKDVATLESLMDSRGVNRNSRLIVYGTPQAYDLFYVLRLMDCNATLIEGDWWQETEWAISSIR